MRPWKLSENGAILIYLILLSGVAAILLAWKMMPKEASRIILIDRTGAKVQTYSTVSVGDRLRYKLDDEMLRVFWNGEVHLHPLSNIRTVDITP
jgi:hypothetical protein